MSKLILLLACVILVPLPLAYAGNYSEVRIVAPQADETVHDNSGNLTVKIAVSPPLNAGAGDYLTLLLDNNAVASGTNPSFALNGINRGSHTLVLNVNAADGTVLASSPQVIFHMWQASRKFRDR
jgi:hypothetical protein